MFKKLLIANRGEIAVRVIRACRELGISPVAIYSEADELSLHVRLADEAYPVGPAPALESYLNIDKVLAAAKEAGADAIHPGYGFLSENAAFATACEKAGITFIGPGPAAMKLLGNKIEARRVTHREKIPHVPGTLDPTTDVAAAVKVAREIGFPVMLKAAAGGGGRGLRRVADPKLIEKEFANASNEAAKAFGDGSLFVEKYVDGGRHIEIQILADRHGTTVYFPERDCSLQRRHQKIIEESPSLFVDAPLRKKMGEAAVKLARAGGYENAGTVEFLVDSKKNFYFMEMNTRLQVEHPVTELVSGIDLVACQIRIAMGERLAVRQEEMVPRGWAIEARIYAEDPERGFAPSPGVIQYLHWPSGGGVRLDSGVYEGWRVPSFYDSMIAKVIASAPTRAEAIKKLVTALGECLVLGIKTNVSFLEDLLEHPRFLEGDFSTRFVDTEFKRPERHSDSDEPVVARIAAALASFVDKGPRPGQPVAAKVQESRWRQMARRDGLR